MEGESRGDNMAKLLESKLFRGRSRVGVAEELMRRRLGFLPLGVGGVKYADWGGMGSSSVVHSLGMGRCEGEWGGLGFGAEEEGVEDVAPSSIRADREWDEDFITVQNAADNGVPRDKFAGVVLGALPGASKLHSFCSGEVLVCGNGR